MVLDCSVRCSDSNLGIDRSCDSQPSKRATIPCSLHRYDDLGAGYFRLCLYVSVGALTRQKTNYMSPIINESNTRMFNMNVMTHKPRPSQCGSIGRVQFACRMMLQFAIGVYFAVAACVIQFHLADLIMKLGQAGSEIAFIACPIYGFAIIVALVFVHKSALEMRRQIRLVRLRR